MAKKRLRIFKEDSCYHLMSRTVNGEVLFGDREKEVFRKMIWKVAEFSGVRVITYAVMKNHFHLLVKVPEVSTEVSDEELVRRFRILYPSPTPWQPMGADVLQKILKEDSSEARRVRGELLSRMHDVSEFMKTLKLRFTLWFNRTKKRFGPLWSARFKSVLVEGDKWALRTVAAYIDLNAVRAGIVSDPKDYRFCGYGEAIGGGSRLAREGLMSVDRDLSGYRQTLYGYGSDVRDGKASVSREEAVRVLEKEKGRLPLATVLRCRVRYFSDGIIFGSAPFVIRELEANADGAKVKAHGLTGSDWQGLSVGKGLRKDLFS